MEKYYSINKIADLNILGMKRSKILRLIKDGYLKVVNVNGDKDKRPVLRVSQSAIEEYCKNHITDYN